MSHNYLHQTSTALEVWSHRDNMPEYNGTLHSCRAEYDHDLVDWEFNCTKTPVAEYQLNTFKDFYFSDHERLTETIYLGEDVTIDLEPIDANPRGSGPWFAHLKPVPEATHKHVGYWESKLEAIPDSTELWREVIDIVDTVSRRSEGYSVVINELKKQFKNIERIK